MLASKPWVHAGVLLATAFLAGCESTNSSTAQSPAELRSRTGNMNDGQLRRRGSRVSAQAEQLARREAAAIIATVQHWHETHRDPTQVYQLNETYPQLHPRLRRQLASYFTPADSPAVAGQQTLTFERVRQPEAGWIYTTYRVGDRYHAIEYAAVFRVNARELELRDHFTIAEGTTERAMNDFRWSAYGELLAEREANALSD